jgi:hypothetical protein
MPNLLLVAVMLTSLAQVGADRRSLPESPRLKHIATSHVMLNGFNYSITLEIYARTAPSDEDDPQPVRPPRGANNRTTVVARENFDRWLFREARSGIERRRHLEDVLRTRISGAARDYKLTEPQQEKLRLAGRGDIKRFFDQVEERRDEFEKDRMSFDSGLAALRRLDDLSQTYRRGPFSSGSLFDKTLQKIKDDQGVFVREPRRLNAEVEP